MLSGSSGFTAGFASVPALWNLLQELKQKG